MTAPETALKPWATGEFDLSALFRTSVRILDRAQILDDIGRHISTARKSLGSKFVLMLFDVDECRAAIESRGTKAGDEMVKAIGQRIGLLLSPRDAIANLGDGKIAILADTSAHYMPAEQFAQDIRDEIQSTSSVGIVLVKGSHRAPEEVLGNASIALRRAMSEPSGALTFHNWMTDVDLTANQVTEISAIAT